MNADNVIQILKRNRKFVKQQASSDKANTIYEKTELKFTGYC